MITAGKSLNQAQKALILLHGRGGTAQGMLPLGNELDDGSFHIIALQAPNNSWYPNSFLVETTQNEPSLTLSVQAVKQTIDDLSARIPKTSIYLAGFSQGACLALETSARFADKYGGILAFTGGLIGKTVDPTHYKGDFQGTPVFMGTSDPDPFIPVQRVLDSKCIFEQLGAHVTLKIYPGMPHTISDEELALAKILLT